MNSVKLLKDVPMVGNQVQPFFWKLFTVKTKYLFIAKVKPVNSHGVAKDTNCSFRSEIFC